MLCTQHVLLCVQPAEAYIYNICHYIYSYITNGIPNQNSVILTAYRIAIWPSRIGALFLYVAFARSEARLWLWHWLAEASRLCMTLSCTSGVCVVSGLKKQKIRQNVCIVALHRTCSVVFYNLYCNYSFTILMFSFQKMFYEPVCWAFSYCLWFLPNAYCPHVLGPLGHSPTLLCGPPTAPRQGMGPRVLVTAWRMVWGMFWHDYWCRPCK